MTGSLDSEDYANVWLPARYLNYIHGSVYLESLEKEQAEKKKTYANRREAVRALLKEVEKYNQASARGEKYYLDA